MSYELRVNGRPGEVYADPEDALDRVRTLMKSNCDIEPEVLDTRTGRAFEPAASIRWREELATQKSASDQSKRSETELEQAAGVLIA
jgi:hypothetical protein